MKRRQALRSLMSLPAIGAMPGFAQQAVDKSKPSPREKLPAELTSAPVEDFPKLAMTQADAAVDGAQRFFSARQFATLTRLCETLVPAFNGRPGAVEADAPRFLDFLLGVSPQNRQSLYRNGLDALEAAAQKQYHKSFAELAPAEREPLLAPLASAWTYQGPSTEIARFLEAAKEDAIRATVDSREWAAAGTQRRSSGLGTYWLPVE